MEWIEQNKEWFLSGAGIFMVSSIVSFLSVVMTLWWKARTERKNKKKLKVVSGLSRFSVPASDNSAKISPEHIKISYKGNEYDNLCIYSAKIQNTGVPAIEKQRLHLLLPSNANVIEVIEKKSLASIDVSNQQVDGDGSRELIFTFERLESNDSWEVNYLLDMKSSASISCKPRGVDNIDYSYKEELDTTEVNKLVMYLATFVFADMIPVFDGLIRALVVIAAAPTVIEIMKNYSQNKRSSDNVLNISGGIKVDESGELSINQITQ